MTTKVDTYAKELLYALRMRDVPGPRIAEVLAEIDSHVRETGEDPTEAFGPPKRYAQQVGEALGVQAVPLWRSVLSWSTLAYGLAGAGGGWFLLEGVTSLATRSRATAPAAAFTLLGLLLLAGLVTALVRVARADGTAVLDPRTGADLTPPAPRWVLPLMLSVPLLTVAIAAVLSITAR